MAESCYPLVIKRLFNLNKDSFIPFKLAQALNGSSLALVRLLQGCVRYDCKSVLLYCKGELSLFALIGYISVYTHSHFIPWVFVCCSHFYLDSQISPGLAMEVP